MPLERELAAYRRLLPGLLGPGDAHAGRWAVVAGDDLLGVRETYEDALALGYGGWSGGPGGFLVRRIERNESILYFSRPVQGSPHRFLGRARCPMTTR